jgi:hypothetical protein
MIFIFSLTFGRVSSSLSSRRVKKDAPLDTVIGQRQNWESILIGRESGRENGDERFFKRNISHLSVKVCTCLFSF